MTDAENIRNQEKQIAELKERVSFLEKGNFVLEKAAEYALRFEEYEAQVIRLAGALARFRAFEKTAGKKK